jgi:hypothetical protein
MSGNKLKNRREPTLFGKKDEASPPEAKREVPVYTVHSLPRSYELICTVYSGKINNNFPSNVLQRLGQAGGAIPECDAVIGLLVMPVGSQLVHAYGTAIRYL